jgi:ABC-type spermidine/putrescine transport system permease subunit II
MRRQPQCGALKKLLRIALFTTASALVVGTLACAALQANGALTRDLLVLVGVTPLAAVRTVGLALSGSMLVGASGTCGTTCARYLAPGPPRHGSGSNAAVVWAPP